MLTVTVLPVQLHFSTRCALNFQDASSWRRLDAKHRVDIYTTEGSARRRSGSTGVRVLLIHRNVWKRK